jgi:hypothetical protein
LKPFRRTQSVVVATMTSPHANAANPVQYSHSDDRLVNRSKYQQKCRNTMMKVTRPTKRWCRTTLSQGRPRNHVSTLLRVAGITRKMVLAAASDPSPRSIGYPETNRAIMFSAMYAHQNITCPVVN